MRISNDKRLIILKLCRSLKYIITKIIVSKESPNFLTQNITFLKTVISFSLSGNMAPPLSSLFLLFSLPFLPSPRHTLSYCHLRYPCCRSCPLVYLKYRRLMSLVLLLNNMFKLSVGLKFVYDIYQIAQHLDMSPHSLSMLYICQIIDLVCCHLTIASFKIWL